MPSQGPSQDENWPAAATARHVPSGVCDASNSGQLAVESRHTKRREPRESRSRVRQAHRAQLGVEIREGSRIQCANRISECMLARRAHNPAPRLTSQKGDASGGPLPLSPLPHLPLLPTWPSPTYPCSHLARSHLALFAINPRPAALRSLEHSALPAAHYQQHCSTRTSLRTIKGTRCGASGANRIPRRGAWRTWLLWTQHLR